MMRTRLLWFTLGFASASATMTHFVFKDLWIDRQSLSSQLKQKFNALDTRISNLEQPLPNSSSPRQKIEIEEESTKEKKRIQRCSLGEDVKVGEYRSLLEYISLSCGVLDKRIWLCDPSGESIHLFDKDSRSVGFFVERHHQYLWLNLYIIFIWIKAF